MANKHDSRIVEELIVISRRGLHDEVVDYFFGIVDSVIDDSTYWNLVASVWIGHGGSRRKGDWLRVFTSSRRGRWKMMKGRDRKVWRKLPNSIRSWRAVRKGEDIEEAISWTLDKGVAERFGRLWDREVKERVFSKERVIAYFDRRREREIIVLPASMIY